jgi:two-component system phosphate regulon sensor histidine kinase PhoR
METTIIVLIILLILALLLFAFFFYRRSKKSSIKELIVTKELAENKCKMIETELSREREKLAALLATIGAGIIILDSERQVTMINKTAADLFRITTDAAVRKPFINLVRDHEMDSIVQKCLETTEKQKGAVRSAGSKKYLDLTAAPLSNGALILVQDMTNIRRLEKIRQDFIANISHELRTPIGSCKAIVETLQGDALNNKTVARDFLQRMHVETDKLAQMVNELGELSRIESGELVLNLEPVDIAVLLSRATARLKAQADIPQLDINLDIPDNLPHATGDADRIEQVLINLLQNSIKFTPKNGKITISSRVQDEMLLISVYDTGIGIPEDDLPHIFERFYKVDKARSGGGTGLGLAIAKHIVQAHGGEIWAESDEGKGSTFTFSLAAIDPQ